MDHRLVLLVLVASICLLLPSTVHGTSFQYCNKQANYDVKIKEVEINPNPIVGGKPAQFNITGYTGDAISKGKVVIDVKYFFIHVHSETKDLCEETSCPVTTGDFVMSHQQILPSFTPPGSYTLTLRVYGEDGKNLLTCVSFGFYIGFISPVADI